MSKKVHEKCQILILLLDSDSISKMDDDSHIRVLDVDSKYKY